MSVLSFSFNVCLLLILLNIKIFSFLDIKMECYFATMGTTDESYHSDVL